MKTEFELDAQFYNDRGHTVNIIGDSRKSHKPYVSVASPAGVNIGYIKDKDLEWFAVNILKALKSKHLK